MNSTQETAIATRAKLLALLLIVAAIPLAQAQAAEWGTLTGKFVVQGKVLPPAVQFPAGVCGGGPILDETLLVGPKGELKNVAIWIAPHRDETAPEPHPDYLKLIETPIELGNLACVYVPHCEVIWTKRPVHLSNKDPITHNYRIDGFKKSFNLLIQSGDVHIQKFEKQEPVPIPVSCSIHPWMRSWLIIRDSPYAAVTAADGTFTIKNLPAGNWTFALWHESTGYLSGLKLNDETTDRRGQCQIKIEPDKVTDLGEIIVQAKDLK
ncbi:hypothetical protein M4951_01695 [Blastopirellula sp. J2-11]|uniref:hypothetical protein n=1 Tax=Blastopirellula sp. J2-11 TaxID=2943192 RepID=UPI0021C6678E|nr:hypothetical protein [Blastopirellula sp. J2-11]UUO07037.1 hypothetical protein M4951_01695 [Blastopirellula sp. J2-11]